MFNVKNILKVFIFLLALISAQAFSFWEWTPQTGRWVNPKYAVQDNAEAQFELAESFRKSGDMEKAIREHRKLVENFRESSYAAESYYALGEIFMERGDKRRAFDYFQRVVDGYPQSIRVLDAVSMQFEIARDNIDTAGTGIFRGRRARRGDLLASVIEQHPYAPESARKSLQLGRFYLEARKYSMAADVFRDLLDRTVDSYTREQAHYYLIKAEYLSVPGVTTDTSVLNSVKERAESFLVRYPESEHVRDVIDIKEKILNEKARKYYEIGSYYERAGRKRAALYYYRLIVDNYPDTHYGKIASEKLDSAR